MKVESRALKQDDALRCGAPSILGRKQQLYKMFLTAKNKLVQIFLLSDLFFKGRTRISVSTSTSKGIEESYFSYVRTSSN